MAAGLVTRRTSPSRGLTMIREILSRETLAIGTMLLMFLAFLYI